MKKLKSLMWLPGNSEQTVLADGGSIHIKPENRGKFTAYANSHGMSVQEAASHVLNNPNASPALRKRANFAHNAASWNKAAGGTFIPPKKDSYNRDVNHTLNWKDDPNEVPHYKDEPFMKDVMKKGAGSAYLINRSDWDNQGSNPGFDQMSGDYKKRVYAEFQKDPNLSEIYAGDINWPTLPAE